MTALSEDIIMEMSSKALSSHICAKFCAVIWVSFLVLALEWCPSIDLPIQATIKYSYKSNADSVPYYI